MAHFEKMDFPEQNRVSYHIIDDYGNNAQLTTELAYELYAWLHEHSDEMFEGLHPETKQKEHVPSVEDIQRPQKLPLLPTDYQPDQGDVYIQEVKAGRFTIHRFYNGEWAQWAALSAQEAQLLVDPMHPLGRTQSMRLYYRPQEGR
jgi:hypothetical protein